MEMQTQHPKNDGLQGNLATQSKGRKLETERKCRNPMPDGGRFLLSERIGCVDGSEKGDRQQQKRNRSTAMHPGMYGEEQNQAKQGRCDQPCPDNASLL